VRIASALVVNVGTLCPAWVNSMKLAAQAANNMGKPWILDPVGAGATPYRKQVLVDLLKLKPTVVRGNASEIMALAGSDSSGKGVDSTVGSSEALAQAMQLAQDIGCVVAVSGAVDMVRPTRWRPAKPLQ
jgi:hydroxyethylthiazole kinase